MDTINKSIAELEKELDRLYEYLHSPCCYMDALERNRTLKRIREIQASMPPAAQEEFKVSECSCVFDELPLKSIPKSTSTVKVRYRNAGRAEPIIRDE